MKARREYLDLNIQAVMVVGSNNYKTMSQSTVAALTSQVKTVANIAADEAASMISLLVDAPLLEEDRQKCIQLVNEKVWLADQGQQDAAPAKQNVTQPYLFLTASDWEAMASTKKTVFERVGILGRRFCGLGLLYPTESSIKNITALALLDQGAPESLLNVALSNGKTLKTLIKASRASRPRGKELPMFDCSAAEFKANFSEWYDEGYKGEVPTNPPIDLTSYRCLTNALGCRVSKTGVAGPPSLRSSQSNQVPISAVRDLIATVQTAMSKSDDIPGLRFFGAGNNQVAPPAGHRAVHALPAFPNRESQGNPSLPALPAIPSVVEQGAPSHQPLALPPPPPTDTVPAQAAASPTAPTQAATVAACPTAMSEACPEKKESSPSDMISSFQDMLQKKNKKNIEKDIKDDENSEACPEKHGKRTPVRKKPSAAPAPSPIVKKRPAAADELSSYGLPAGWKIDKRQRQSGKSAGYVDIYFINPNGKVLRSMREVEKELKTKKKV